LVGGLVFQGGKGRLKLKGLSAELCQPVHGGNNNFIHTSVKAEYRRVLLPLNAASACGAVAPNFVLAGLP
jgi:hypothetical protein